MIKPHHTDIQPKEVAIMKKSVLCIIAALTSTVAVGSALAEQKTGEAIFKEKCASCHPNGGNVINPKEQIKGMKDPKIIVAKIRKGGGGMPVFDQKVVTDADAKAIADYIIKTFKK
jgi:cytochrome c6